MTKVYAVCSGEKSNFAENGPEWTDCLIERVFKREDKANDYAKLCTDHDAERGVKLGKTHTTAYWVEEHVVEE